MIREPKPQFFDICPRFYELCAGIGHGNYLSDFLCWRLWHMSDSKYVPGEHTRAQLSEMVLLADWFLQTTDKRSRATES